MRRFWVFPLFFAGVFAAFQSMTEVFSHLQLLLNIRLISSSTDVYTQVMTTGWSNYLPVMAPGSVAGLIFAALDFALHFPDDPRGFGALQHLLGFWRFGLLTLAIMLANSVFLTIGLVLWESQRRYHAYSPSSTILDWIGAVPPLIFLLLLVWTTQKTLRRPRRAN